MTTSATFPQFMVKRALAFVLFACASLSFLSAHAENEKYASIVVDMDSQQVLHDRFADSPRYPASITKVMTLYMVFDALDEGELTLDEKLPVTV